MHEALRFEKCSEYVWKSLGFAYAQQKNVAKALSLLKKYAQLSVALDDQKNLEEKEQVADHLVKLGQFWDSIQLYTECLKQNERNPAAHFKRSVCRCLVGQSSVLYLEDLKRYYSLTRAIEVSQDSLAELGRRLEACLALFKDEGDFAKVHQYFATKIKEYY